MFAALYAIQQAKAGSTGKATVAMKFVPIG